MTKNTSNSLDTNKKALGGWADIVKTLILALLIAGIFRSFLYQPFHIPSRSMQPNLLVGDYLIVSKYSYGYSRWSLPFGMNLFDGKIMASEPERGDIIVFRPPVVRHGKDVFIKRLIGLPGDTVQMVNGRLLLNNIVTENIDDGQFIDDQTFIKTKQIKEKLEDIEYKIMDTTLFGDHDNTEVFTVPEKHYFFMGDNRDNSSDSRVFKFVHEDNLIGRAEFIMFSFNGFFLKFWDWRFDRFFTSLRK